MFGVAFSLMGFTLFLLLCAKYPDSPPVRPLVWLLDMGMGLGIIPLLLVLCGAAGVALVLTKVLKHLFNK